ncbi:DUF222 domain-containing protein [Microbacterium saccharophilum]|uniref:DUF222 domain-containing protein n=1 Tax=Microbacterium saccharophilum TaxID=1213358 RepID=A0A5C8I0X0_9MICO|nr:HNH endonuclease signature motif containing protein [Microbacterium saccharophilum]TXK11490.1 DUF222 domain-containing protein [Microbacterium saccharophilum]GEP48460.1 hypothetical protein MSA03_19680 [Microbacterium saccharophilum]
MTFLAEVASRARAVAAHDALDVEPASLPAVLRRMPDDAVVALLEEASALIGCAERLKVAAAGVVAERSAAPHGGLAGTLGHRSPVTLVQEITGGSRGEASRTVRVGAALLEGPPSAPDPHPDAEPATPVFVWHAGLRDAMLGGAVTAAQHDAIRRGLGDPAECDGAAEVWAIAAQQLVGEAPGMPVEELGKRARAVRDALDPVGAGERFAQRYAGRAFRTWTDADGVHHARIDFDDETFAWVQSITDAALRPRRGGPRFMTDLERAQADELVRDPRTNEQLAYDLMMDVLRAGALASAEDVFGARQPGVRLVVVKDAVGPRDPFGRLLAVGNLEDGGEALPGAVLDRALCDTGSVTVTVDRGGNPLDVGREQRLFSGKQRMALAVRDGGCLWPGCDRPPSYCEAHHADHWEEDHGCTDIDRGVLLCRFHHLLLHNQGWKISRDGTGPFVLHPPGGSGETVALRSKSPVRWAWDPPPDRGGWRAA